jgi:hypothetical protein
MQRENPMERDAGFARVPPAAGFRLLRYFAVTSLIAFLPIAAVMLYLEREEGEFFEQVQRKQGAIVKQMQDGLAEEQDANTRRDLLTTHEAGNVNLTRLLANALWEKDFAPFVAKAQRIPVDRCRAIGNVRDAAGKTVPPGERQACFAEAGKKILALPGFKAIDAKGDGS